MARSVTQYDLLISCPGDVQKEISIIKEVVDEFNRNFGEFNLINVACKHWATNSYPQLGERPQKILNEQFVKECDLAVAVFWTRFGTPTDEYGSGSEEEIEEMIKDGKQVFLYFLTKPPELDKIDLGQLAKVRDFQEKCTSKGLYAKAVTEESFREQIRNHLTLYFLKKCEGGVVENTVNNKAILKVRDATLSNEGFCIKQFNLTNSQFLLDKKEKITEKINAINMIDIPLANESDIAIKKDATDMISPIDSNLKKLSEAISKASFSDLITTVAAELSAEQKSTIQNFMDSCDISFDDSFWYVGKLKKNASMIQYPLGGSSPSYNGTSEEKQKYELLNEAYWDIKEYNEYILYFEKLDSLKCLSLVLCNEGTSFDEDIDVKLFLEANKLLSKKDIFIPSINIIAEINKINLLEILFTIKENEKIEAYQRLSVPSIPKIKLPNNPLFGKNLKEEYDENVEIYKSKIGEIFDYRVHSNDESDVVCVHFEYIKHHTNIAFPALLLLENLPTTIRYVITSKYSPDKFEGEILLTE